MKKFRIAAVVLMALVALVAFTGCSTLFGDETKWTAVEDPVKELVGKWVYEEAWSEADAADAASTFKLSGKATGVDTTTIDYPKRGEDVKVTAAGTVTFTNTTAYSELDISTVQYIAAQLDQYFPPI